MRMIAEISYECSTEHVRSRRLQNALKSLSEAIREVDAALEETRAEHDPLALHIFLPPAATIERCGTLKAANATTSRRA